MTAAGFDEWYANMRISPAQQRIQQESLGLPPELLSSSLLPWEGIAEVVAALQLQAGETVVDLACGRGGYGLEVARRTGAHLIGIDFSAVAIEQARMLAGDVGAEFRIGDLLATGLPDAVADAVLCVDAMQFADPCARGLAECLRILKSGGRLVFTGWQAIDLADEDIPERLRRDVDAELCRAGFLDVTVTNRPAWRTAERTLWQTAAATDPAGDAALQSMRAEGTRVLRWLERTSRLLAIATRP